MSCLQAIEGEDTENPFICHIMNLLWSLSDKGTRVRFCWVPSHCGIDGNERVDQLAKETLDKRYRPTGKCSLYRYETTGQLLHSEVGSNQVGCSCTWQRSLSCETNTGATGEVPAPNQSWRGCNTRLWIGHTKATKSHILSRGPPTGCHHCGETLTIDHMLLECALLQALWLQECRDEYYTVDSLNALFETIPDTCFVEFLWEAGFFYLIWCNFNFN